MRLTVAVASFVLLAVGRLLVAAKADFAPVGAGPPKEAADDERRLVDGLARLVLEIIKLLMRDGRPTIRPSEKPTIRPTEEPQPRGEQLLELKLPKDCGKTAARQGGRASSGYTAKRGEFPSFVRLDIQAKGAEDSEDPEPELCGATLISERHVLTAGHCLEETSSRRRLSISAATTMFARTTPEGEEPGNRYLVAKSCRSTTHNLALLVLDRRVEFSERVQPACLAREPIKGRRGLRAVGLGASQRLSDDPLDQTWPRQLRALPARWKACNASRQANEPGTVCFESDDPLYLGDTCEGDDGGPIYGTESGRQVVVAAHARGDKICYPGKSRGFSGADIQALRSELARLMESCG